MIFDECWSCKKEEEDRNLAAEIQKRNEEAKKKAEFERLKSYFVDHSFINDNLKRCTLDTYTTSEPFQQRAHQIASEYIDLFSLEDPKSLVLYGSCGTGKSHLAVSVIKRLIQKGYTGIFVSVPKLLQAFKDTYQRDSEISEGDLFRALEKADCLVLDDIGAEKTNDWASGQIFNIIDSRQGKSTIFTTNLDPTIPMEKDFKQSPIGLEMKIGKRNFSRVMMNARVLNMSGEDFRKM